jgi:hypothetical protein
LDIDASFKLKLKKMLGFPQKQTDLDNFKGYIFYDYECTVENGVHVLMLIMAQTVCVECLDKKLEGRCDNDQEKHIFRDNKSFCRWLFKQEHFIGIAHNFKGYDGSFSSIYHIFNV